MRRWGWWGLAGLGLLAVAAGIWTLAAPDAAASDPRPVARHAGCARGGCRAAELPAGLGLPAEGALETALSVSFLDPAGAALAAATQARPEPPAHGLPALAAGMHLARARIGPRAVPEAPLLLLLGLALLAGFGRRRTRAGSRGPC